MVATKSLIIAFAALMLIAVSGCQLTGNAGPTFRTSNRNTATNSNLAGNTAAPQNSFKPPQMIVRGQNGNVLPPPVSQPTQNYQVPQNYQAQPTQTYQPPQTYQAQPATPPQTYAPQAPYGSSPGIEAVPSIAPGVNYDALPPPVYNGGTLYGPAVNSNIEPLSPIREVPVDIWLTEARTGRFMVGGAVNSDAGVTGQIVLDERNFDITRVPRSFSELFSGRAFRGAGQSFRIEAVPGSQFQRYMVSFGEPYLLGYLPLSFSVNGFLFDRRYQDYDETRIGGRTSLGYRITPDLTLEMGLRGENVEFKNPRIIGIPEVDRLVGDHDLYSASLRLTHDTRDIPFAPTEGHLLSLEYEQVFGSFDYPRFNAKFQNFTLLKQRPDGSGRHTLAFSYDLGLSGSQTPIFENYFAGGYSTLRGFSFRGVGPTIATFQTGGRARFLGSAEYQFPITADDMFKGVVFLDYGTVERDLEFDAENLRVAPGFGFRVAIPAMGPAPLAFDFGFPIASNPTDDEQMFSFFVGFNR